MSDKRLLDWLEENAPLAIWRGHLANGTPVVDILRTDLDGRLNEDADALGFGRDLREAVQDAMEEQP
jgi:hypothetical protein